MCRNVLREFLLEKSVYYLRRVVRNSVAEALVECQQMASSASVGEFHRRHQLASARRLRRHQSGAWNGAQFVPLLVAHRRRAITFVSKRRIRAHTRGPVAVSAFQLHYRPRRTLPYRFEVHRMIELDRSRIAGGQSAGSSQRRKFRMPAGKALDTRCEARSTIGPLQIAMALGARRVARRGK